MAKRLLVTGSSGLIGSEVCRFFGREDFTIHGIDNNQRATFFGPQGDTRWNQQRLSKEIPGFVHHELDIRDRQGVLALLAEIKPDVIVHTAAQPSHDRAAAIPFDDFDTNAVGTLNLLEAARRACPESPFVPHVDQQGLRRPAQYARAERTGNALGLRRCRVRPRHRGNFLHRPVEALALRRVEGRRRRHGPGIRPLLPDSVLRPARRLPHRPESQRASSSTASSATS